MSEDHIWKVAQSVGFDDYELRPMLEAFAAALSQPAPSPQAPGRRKGPPGITLEPQGHEQPAVPVVSDEQIIDKIIQAGFTYYTTQRTMDEMRADIRAILALRPAAVPLVSGWSIDDHRDGSVTIETPEGRIISLHRSGGSGMESIAYSLAILALRPQAVEPMTERWAVVRETVLDVGRGSDVRTGGRPELGYALISDAATFDNEADAVAAINSTGLPVGWVVMPLSRLLPDTFGITARAEGGA